MKPQHEKSNKHGSYSLWEDVVKGDESVCGIYLSYEQLAAQLTPTNDILRITFPVTIGFDMLLPLQGFNLFPNSLFGDLNLIIKVSPNGLVWACTDPELYLADRKRMINCGTDFAQYQISEQALKKFMPLSINDYFSHRFTQVRVDGLARSQTFLETSDSNQTYAQYIYAPLRIDPSDSITLDATSTIMGFSLKDSVKSALATYYREVPFVIPAECITIQSYSTGPSASGLNCSVKQR
jgi:hypothetical protein